MSQLSHSTLWRKTHKEKYDEYKRKHRKKGLEVVQPATEPACLYCGAILPRRRVFQGYCDKTCYLEDFRSHYCVH